MNTKDKIINSDNMNNLKQYIEQVNENRNNKGLILQDLIALVRFDEYVETYS